MSVPAYSTVRAAFDRIPGERHPAMRERMLSFAEGIRKDCAEWTPSSDIAQLYVEFAELFDALSDVMEDIDPRDGDTMRTDRDDRIANAEYDRGHDAGLGDAREESQDGFRYFIERFAGDREQEARYGGPTTLDAHAWRVLGERMLAEWAGVNA